MTISSSSSTLTDNAPWLIHKYESYKQLEGLLAKAINPSQSRYVNRKTQSLNKRGQPYMPRRGFEPIIQVFEQSKTFYALDCAATLSGTMSSLITSNGLRDYVQIKCS
jgi:hypothetical protein